MRTLIIKEQSQVLGLENMKSIQEAVDRGENVVILSNHQTEADPPVRAQIVFV
jgi:1-acyl-sn-glycerol-3-phosphate acyltransferase